MSETNSTSNRADAVVAQLLGERPIAYNPALAEAFDSISAAILLHEIAHWEKYSDDGWVYRTEEQIYEATKLKRGAQQHSRKTLRGLGILEERRNGVPARLRFRIKYDIMSQLLLQLHENRQLVAGNGPTINSGSTRVNDEETSSSSADEPPESNGKAPKPKNGITRLMDRVKAAKERGANVTPLPDRERRSIGGYYRQAILDDHLPEHVDLALDYMVAKASGEVEGEPKAWCGFGTALDTVELEGWRPGGRNGGTGPRLSEEEAAAWQAEQEQMMAELLKEDR